MTIRVLIADDEPLIRAGLRMILEEVDDLEVVAEAVDGEQAVALASRLAPDVVVMDVRMPGVDGIEATRRIREGEAKRGPGGRGRVPIIALTASVMDEDRQKCLSAGMDDFLTKPLDPNALTAAIARWTKTRARAA